MFLEKTKMLLTNRNIFSILVINVVLFLVLAYYTSDSRELNIRKSNAYDDKSYLKTNKNPVHVFYVHYLESNDKLSANNFIYFMNIAYFPCNPNIYYTFVFNRDKLDRSLIKDLTAMLGKEITASMSQCLIADDKIITNSTGHPNTKLILRQNSPGGDLCASVDMLKSQYWIQNEKIFSFYFFINSSVRGPFLPNYWLRPWWEMFTNIFEKYPKTAVMGPYMSCEFNPHIQSFMIVMDIRGLETLKTVWRCPVKNEPRQDWIVDTEVKLGSKLLQKGYEMRSLLSIYNGLGSPEDFSDCQKKNPFFSYPIDRSSLKNDFDIYKNSCSKKFIEKDIETANVFELVWVKFGGSFQGDQISNYIKKYVPFYTKLMLQWKRRHTR